MELTQVSAFTRLQQRAATCNARDSVADGWETCGRHGPWQRDFLIDGTRRSRHNCPQCVAEAEAFAVLERSAIPLRFQGKTVNNFEASTEAQRAAKIAVAAYAQDVDGTIRAGRNMLMLGGVGTGKTHLSCAVAQRFMSVGKSAMYVTVQEIIGTLRATWRRDSELSERDVFSTFVRPDLLVIDEVGVQAGSENEQTLLFGVIGARHANKRPMILMSNLPLQAQGQQRGLKDYLGARLYDRMLEGGGSVVIFDWQSYRTAAK
jgi:DNA replication protein DnaC